MQPSALVRWSGGKRPGRGQGRGGKGGLLQRMAREAPVDRWGRKILLGKTMPGLRNSKCKGPEVTVCVMLEQRQGGQGQEQSRKGRVVARRSVG